MPKKTVLIAIGVIGIVAIVGGGFFLFRGRGESEISKIVSPSEKTLEEEKPTTKQAKTLTWNDPAGFIFSYNSALKINNHPEDKVNYANLEITEQGEEGKILVLAKDSKYKTLADWVSKEYKGKQVLETTLGGKGARKILDETGKITVGALDENILFTLEMIPGNRDSWQKNFEQIVSSFEFWYPTPAQSNTQSSQGGSGGGDVVEEEEIIE